MNLLNETRRRTLFVTAIGESDYCSVTYFTCTERSTFRVDRAMTRATFALWIQHGLFELLSFCQE